VVRLPLSIHTILHAAFKRLTLFSYYYADPRHSKTFTLPFNNQQLLLGKKKNRNNQLHRIYADWMGAEHSTILKSLLALICWIKKEHTQTLHYEIIIDPRSHIATVGHYHYPSSSDASTSALNNPPSRESNEDGLSNSAALPSSITSTRSLSIIVFRRCATVMHVAFLNSSRNTL